MNKSDRPTAPPEGRPRYQTTKHDPHCDCGICQYCNGQEDCFGNPTASEAKACPDCEHPKHGEICEVFTGGFRCQCMTDHSAAPSVGEKPPLGVMPEWRWLELRIEALQDAIDRQREKTGPVVNGWEKEIQLNRSRLTAITSTPAAPPKDALEDARAFVETLSFASPSKQWMAEKMQAYAEQYAAKLLAERENEDPLVKSMEA